MTSGVLGALGLFLFIFFGFKTFKQYFKAHRDEFRLQATMLLFLVIFVFFAGLFGSGEYALYYNIYRPVYLTAPFMLMVFMFSYVVCKTKASVETGKEEIKSEEVKVDEQKD